MIQQPPTATGCFLMGGSSPGLLSCLKKKIKWREKCFQLKRFRAESEICCADVSYGWNFTINTWPTSSTPTFILTRKWFFIEKHILDLHLIWLANGGRGTFLFFLVRSSALSRTFTTLWLVVVSRFYNSLHCTFRHFRQVKGGKWRTGAATTILFWFIMIAIDFHFHLSCACLLFSCISRGQYDRQGFPFFRFLRHHAPDSFDWNDVRLMVTRRPFSDSVDVDLYASRAEASERSRLENSSKHWNVPRHENAFDDLKNVEESLAVGPLAATQTDNQWPVAGCWRNTFLLCGTSRDAVGIFFLLLLHVLSGRKCE